MLTKEYLGEVVLPLDDRFRREGWPLGSRILVIRWAVYSWWWLISSYVNLGAGSRSLRIWYLHGRQRMVQIKIEHHKTLNAPSSMDFLEIYAELVRRSRPSHVSAPPVRPHFSFHPNSLSLTCLLKPNPITQQVLALSTHASLAPNTKTTGDKIRRVT